MAIRETLCLPNRLTDSFAFHPAPLDARRSVPAALSLCGARAHISASSTARTDRHRRLHRAPRDGASRRSSTPTTPIASSTGRVHGRPTRPSRPAPRCSRPAQPVGGIDGVPCRRGHGRHWRRADTTSPLSHLTHRCAQAGRAGLPTEPAPHHHTLTNATQVPDHPTTAPFPPDTLDSGADLSGGKIQCRRGHRRFRRTPRTCTRHHVRRKPAPAAPTTGSSHPTFHSPNPACARISMRARSALTPRVAESPCPDTSAAAPQ